MLSIQSLLLLVPAVYLRGLVLAHLCTKWTADNGFGASGGGTAGGRRRRGEERHAWGKGTGRRCDGCEGTALHGCRAGGRDTNTGTARHTPAAPPASTTVRKHVTTALHRDCGEHIRNTLHTPQA